MTRAGCAVHFRFYQAQGKTLECLRLTACLALPSPASEFSLHRELFPAPRSEDDTLEFSTDLVFLTTANVDDAFHRYFSTGAAFITAVRVDGAWYRASSTGSAAGADVLTVSTAAEGGDPSDRSPRTAPHAPVHFCNSTARNAQCRPASTAALHAVPTPSTSFRLSDQRSDTAALGSATNPWAPLPPVTKFHDAMPTTEV